MRKESEEEGLRQPGGEGGGGGERRPWWKEEIAPLKEGQGVPEVEDQGPRGGGGGPELTACLSLPPPSARPHLGRLLLGSPRGNGYSPPGRPPQSSPPPRVAGPSPGGGRQRPQHPAPRLLSGYLGSGLRSWRLAAVSTLVPGGLRLRPPRCRPPRPRFWAVAAAAEAAETLEGPAAGAGAPHYCFISRGPAKSNAGHETTGTRSPQLT